jgi:hypothetical protein
MALRLLGIDPNTEGMNCPTVWLDESTGDFIVQGWRIKDQETLAQIGDVPDGETVLRLPRRMTRFLLEEAG